MRPRGRRLTAPQREALAAAVGALDSAEAGVLFPVPRKHTRVLRALLESENAASTPGERDVPGIGLVAVERGLSAAGARYAPWVAGNPSPHLRTLQLAGATEEQCALVGRFIGSWARFQGSVTLGTVARKWGEYLAGAVAWAGTGTEAPVESGATPAPEPGHWG